MKTPSETLIKSSLYLSPIQAKLQQVEGELHGEVESAFGIASQVVMQLMGAGGKRIRPVIILLASQMSGYEGERAVNLAAALEMIHTATLLHDDVVDESPLRRGNRSAWNAYGSKLSIITGDYLFARSFARLAKEADPVIWKEVAFLVERLCEGELVQYTHVRNLEMTTEIYLEVIEKKTAHFFETCTVVGGLLGGWGGDYLEGLRRFGYHFGMIFQISDDLLDYVGDPEVLGKPVGGDLREGKVTLPLIEGIKVMDPTLRARVDHYLEHGGEENEHQEILTHIRESGVAERIRAFATQYQQHALDELKNFPANAEREALQSLTEHIMERTA